MFESIIAGFLNKFLGDYVANLETKQLSIGIWQGDVVLHNLRLRREALDKFNLPVDVVEGYLGDLTLSIPWNDLKNKPVRAFINNVYILATPKADTDYDPVLEEDRALKLKMEKIEAAEMLSAKDKLQDGPENKQNTTFVTQLITKIVDNLQITIQNIHIRYEDRVGIGQEVSKFCLMQKANNEQKPISVGITLSELSAVSTDENWNEAFIHEEIGVIHKIIRLGSFSIYWNTNSSSLANLPQEKALTTFMSLIASGTSMPSEHQYILKPVSGQGRLVINKFYKPGQARNTIMLEFEELGFVLDDEQYLTLFLLIGSFSSFLRSQPFRKYRPPRTITPLIDPLAWFKYAGTCVLSEIHERNRRWTWSFFAERRDERMLYVKLYKILKSSTASAPLSPENTELLKLLERKLSYNDIRFYRSIASNQLKRERATIAANIAKIQPQQTTLGWIGDWWSGNHGQMKPQDISGASLTDDQVQQIFETIEYDPKSSLLENDIPKDAVLLSLQWKLRQGSFAVKLHRRRTLLALVFENLTAGVIQHPSSIVGNLSLGGLTLTDGSTEDNLYPILIQPIQDTSNKFAEDFKRPFFNLSFEHNPIDERADEAVTLTMLPLQVIYNPTAVGAIIDFFSPPATELDTVSTLRSVAQDTLHGLTAQTRAGLEFAIESHRTVDVKIDMAAPIFIFPESASDANCMVLVIDAGHLLVESNLVSKETKLQLERRQGFELTAEDFAKMESLLFDRFTCALTSVQALVGRSVESCLRNVRHPVDDNSLHFLERVDMEFKLEICILPKLVDHVRLAITGKLPRLHINMSDRKYKTIMKVIELIAGRSEKASDSKVEQIVLLDNKPIEWAYAAGSSMTEIVLEDSDESFFDAEENLESKNSLGGGPLEPPEKILLKFSFDVGQVSASLKKSDRQATGLAEKTLADLKISGFDLLFIQRPYDMIVKVKILSAVIEDRMNVRAESASSSVQYLLTPSKLITDETDQHLVLIDYSSIKASSSLYKGVDQSIEVSFASVDVILIKESILSLYDFLLLTFTSAGSGDKSATPTEIGKTDLQLEPHSISEESLQSNVMVIRMTMRSINFIITEASASIATASFGAGQLSLTLRQNRTSITGRLGNLSIVDNVLRAGDGRLFTQFLRIEGSQVANFTLDTFDPRDPEYPGYDTSLQLLTSSVHLTYIEPLISELTSYFQEFTRMHVLLDSARKAAVETQETAGKFHFDLQIETPILEFPDASLLSPNAILMYLGRISAKNEFLTSSDASLLNTISADIQSLKLISNFERGDGVQSTRMIEDVNIVIKLSSITPKDQLRPPSSHISIQTNEIVLKWNKMQYRFILDTLNSISRSLESKDQPSEAKIAEVARSTDEENHIDDTQRQQSSVTTDIRLSIPAISLELAGSIDPLDNSSTSRSIARFAIISFDVDGVLRPNSSKDFEVHIASMRIWDTRQYTGNLYTEIMPSSSHSHDQLSARVSWEANGCISSTVSCDSFKLVLVLEHLFSIRDFFSTNQTESREGGNGALSAQTSKNMEVNEVGRSKYRVTLVGIEIVLLHDATVENSEAIILVAKEMVLSSDVVLTLSILEMGMFFSVMNERKESTLRFIQDFDLTLVLDNRLTAPGHRLTSIYVDISPLLLRVSYRDVSLILDIFHKVTGFTDSSKKVSVDTSEPSSTMNIVPAEDLVMLHEKIQVTTRGMRVILIDDLNDVHLPMFDVVVDKLVIEVSDWTSMMRIDTGLKLHINNFNVKNSHWEPLIELFEFYLNVSKQRDESVSVDVYARKKLELNISHVFIETALNAAALISKQNRIYVPRSHTHSPYILRNKTGYSMHIWAETTGDGLDTELKQLQNDEEISWRFDDWRALRESVSPVPNQLSLQIHGPGWETLKGIPVDREGVKTYTLRPKIDRVSHRLVCEVMMKNNRKIVTFRSSTVIINGTTVPVDLMVVNLRNQKTAGIFTLAPGDTCSIPIEASFYDKILVRPQEHFGYHWSNELLYWRELQKNKAGRSPFLVSCLSTDPSTPLFKFQVNSTYPADVDVSNYPFVTMKLLPPFQIENLLPYDFRYVIYDKSARQELRGSLPRGAIDPVHTVDPTHSLWLSIEIPGTEFRPSELAVLSNAELDYRDEQITLTDSEGLELHLRIKYSDKLEFGGRKVSIYSPYIILNKTGAPAAYSTRSLMVTSRLAAGQGSMRKNKSDPFMFSYTSFEPLKSRALIRVGDSEWSKPLSFEAVGSSFDVTIPSPVKGQEVHVGITIREGDGKFFHSKIVTVAPRFVLKNNLSEDINCRQHASLTPTTVKAGTSMPLLYFLDSDQRQLSLRLSGLMDEWSTPFNINQIGQVFIKLGRMGTSNEDLLRAEVMLEGATVFVAVSREEGRWPFRIENNVDVDVTFWQLDSKAKFLVKPQQARPYAWDHPSAANKALVLHVDGARDREIDVREIGQLRPMKFPIPGEPGKTGIISIRVYAEGPTLVVNLGPYIESKSLFRPGTVRKDSLEDSFTMKKKEAKEVMVLQVKLQGIGISLISREVQEILYASAKRVDFAYSESTATQAIIFSIGWLQIDNQLQGTLEPIFLYPSVLPKEGEESFHPVLMASLSKAKDTSYGVDYYNWFTILLQEISVDLDEDFLYALINFAKFDVAGWDTPEPNIFNSDVLIPTPRIVEGDVRMYFEKFLVQPMQFNISFQRTHTETVEESRGASRNVLTFFFDVFTMTVGNIHDAPIRLNALEIYHPIVTLSELVDLMVKFYSQEVVGQIHKFIGSADFLGNPVGLFNNVGSGVRDFFYEPIQGFEITRPQDFGIGLAKGTTSLFKKTVYGVTDTLSKFTASVSKGIAVMTFDEEFQEKRRLSSVRNRPRHAGHGVAAGATSLVTSVASGLSGVLSKPIEGAGKDGVGGFFKGLGKGIVGVVSKPLTGVFDLATNVSEGIRNTTTVFDKELEKIRLPRFIGRDGILTPYDSREAQGLQWLRTLDNGRYFHDQYFGHLELKIEDLAVIVTDRRTLMAKLRSLRVEWEVPFEDLQLARLDDGGITLIQKGYQQAKARIIPCSDKPSAQWLLSRIETMFSLSIK